MHALNATLSLASQALSSESGALAVTNNNITNVNTVGYSREIVNLSAQALQDGNGGSEENGVVYNGFTSVRNEVLQIAIQQKTADVGSLTVQNEAWNQVQTAFSSTTSGVGASLSSLFSSLSTLSATPTSDGARQAALSAASAVTAAFHQAAATVQSAQTQADSNVNSIVANINQITNQIASLNQQLAASQASGHDGGSVEDQRDALTIQLAALTGLTSTTTQSTPNLSTAGSSPLVIGGTAYALQTIQGSDGKTHVLDAQGRDITSSLTGGSLGGTLTTRDSTLSGVSTRLDALATQFATAFNTAQKKGYSSNGSQGTDMFSLPTYGTSAAAGITLAISDTEGLAISSDGSAGSSGNLSNLLAVQTTAMSGGQTPTDTYASLVQGIGVAGSTVSSTLTATNSALAQLSTQQSSESGVSIDEETTRLLQFQQAYTAAAKVISVINDLYSTLMNMGVTA